MIHSESFQWGTQMSDKITRSSFSGKIGFVLSAAGSAVGLGNIWRFPYLAAKYGGGIFLLVYILLAVTFGFTLMCAEIALGRKTGLSAIGAFKALDRRFAFVGYLEALVPIIILSYYCVIGGWVVKYLVEFISGGAAAAANPEFFGGFISLPGQPLIWFFVYLALTAVVVLMGVDKGIEKVSRIMMPVLVILTIFVAVYSVFLPNAMQGVKYYLLPDFKKFSVKTVLAAMGQLFYSMSLAMGIMITYGSYMKKDVNVETSVRQIEIFDTGIAFLAGLMIIPAVFSFSGGDQAALGKGPSLMFITLPQVFTVMKGGSVIGILFFFLVLLAALTSSISMMEAVVSIFQDRFRISRGLSCLTAAIILTALGIPSVLGYSVWSGMTVFGMQVLDFLDFISNSILMPVVAFFTCIFIGYVIKPEALIEEAEISAKFRAKKLFIITIKYFAPICIILILLSSVLEAAGIFSI